MWKILGDTSHHWHSSHFEWEEETPIKVTEIHEGQVIDPSDRGENSDAADLPEITSKGWGEYEGELRRLFRNSPNPRATNCL